jgi:predicted metallo-beta-lactamase superfamily hydrolase
MQITIIGTESLGVRGLCCVVKTKDRKVVIDPGVALGFRRHGLMPHPVQVIASERTRSLIDKVLANATDIVLSHYHGDHIPLVDPNPYQLSVQRVAILFKHTRLWAKGLQDISENQVQRAKSLSQSLGRTLLKAEGICDGPLAFSLPVPHGERDSRGGSVMMTRIEEDGKVFVHASDIQMLSDEAIDQILSWQTNVVFASGPPVYLPGLTAKQLDDALHRTLFLAKEVDTLILDHHLMRSKKGEQWLDQTSSLAKHRIVCAADLMGIPRNLLEAERTLWYKKLPVPDGWHQAYAQGKVDVISEWSDKIEQVRMR